MSVGYFVASITVPDFRKLKADKNKQKYCTDKQKYQNFHPNKSEINKTNITIE